MLQTYERPCRARRRLFGASCALLGLAMLAALGIGNSARAANQDAGKNTNKEGAMKSVRLYIGTYTGGKSKGIYRLDLDLEKGKFGEPTLAGEVANPSFLAIHPSKKFLYAVSEIDDFNGQKTGAVAALSVDPKTGDLTLLNKEACGAGPCHVTTDKAGKNVLVASYSGGSAAVLPIGADGKLQKLTSKVELTVPNKDGGQQSALGHSVNLDPANERAFIAFLAADAVAIKKFDAAKGELTPNEPGKAEVKKGSGPRHFAFHPDGTKAYVINESSLTLTAFAYDPKTGALTETQTISTLPGETMPGYSTAEVVVHPSGKFVYGSNRGHNSIAAFSIAKDGKLASVGHATEGIKTPRNFNVDPTGQYLIVANQDGDSLTLFRINQETGALEPTGETVAVPMPVCIKFM